MKRFPQTPQEWLGEENKVGLNIYYKKYRYKNETFPEFIRRISGGDKELGEQIMALKFLPGGRIMAGRGISNDTKVSYSNCYVVSPPKDNLESIFDTAKHLARIYSYGGGSGVDISKLSPAGATIRNAAKTTSGAVSFIELYAMITKLIGQRGRRGAMMISLDCHHPDLPEFIKLKTDPEKATSANLSIRVNKGFMDAVKDNKDWTMSFTRKETGETVKRTMPAREIMHMFAEANWHAGEPGILFWDHVSKDNLLEYVPDFHYAGVNPCGEEPLPEYGSCLLGSINLSAFVENPFTEDAVFKIDELKETVRIAVKGMNDILDEGIEKHPLEIQQITAKNWRQIGIGIMGFADMLLKMNIRYGSEKAENFTNEIGYIIAKEALETSIELAKKDGPFPIMANNATIKEQIKESDFFQNHSDTKMKEDLMKYGIRNSQLLTIAPTGSIATMIGASSGMEPLFAFRYTMKTESLDGKESYYEVDTPIVKEYRKSYGLSENDSLPYIFVSSHDIPYKKRINMQAAWQRHIDASISSTCNLPNSCTIEDIENLYMYAYEKNLKGITVFREGCDRAPVLTNKDETKKEEPKTSETKSTSENHDDIYEHLIGLRRKLITGCGSLHLVAMFHEDTGELYEIFLNKGSTGGCNSFMNALSRFISKSAQKGMTVDEICDQLSSSITCVSYRDRTREKKDTSKGTSCPSAVGYALKDMYNDMQNRMKTNNSPIKTEKPKEKEKIYLRPESKCPNCGMPLVFEGGCNICKSCGWSKCF